MIFKTYKILFYMRRVENLGFISRLDTRKNDFSSKILDDYKRNTYRGECKNRLVPYKSMVKKKIRIVRALIVRHASN